MIVHHFERKTDYRYTIEKKEAVLCKQATPARDGIKHACGETEEDTSGFFDRCSSEARLFIRRPRFAAWCNNSAEELTKRSNRSFDKEQRRRTSHHFKDGRLVIATKRAIAARHVR